MKILITGASGFIGQNLITSLYKQGCDVHAVIRETSKYENNKIDVFRYNGKPELLIDYFYRKQFDGVVHLASLFLSEHTPKDISFLMSSNLTFGTEILEACKSSRVKWFITTGTFGQNYMNNDYNPVNLYSATKEAFRTIAEYYIQTSDIVFSTIKLFDTFGPNDTRPKIIKLWSEMIQTGKTLKMSGGEQIVDMNYIEDVTNAYKILIKHLSQENRRKFNRSEFVVSSNERMTLKQFAEVFEEIADKKLNILWGERPYRSREVMNPWDKGINVPEWKQKYTIREALSRTLKKL